MAISYHISPNGPRMCRAKKGLCPYARAGAPHFETSAEAQSAYESKMTETFGMTRAIFKKERDRGIVGKINRERRLMYDDIDRIQKVGKIITNAGRKTQAFAIAAVSKEARSLYKDYLSDKKNTASSKMPHPIQNVKRNSLTFKKKMLQFVAKTTSKLNERATKILDAKYSTPKYKDYHFGNSYGGDFNHLKSKKQSNKLAL